MKMTHLAAAVVFGAIVSASTVSAATIVGSFSGGDFLQSGSVTNSSGQLLTGVTIDLSVDAGSSGNGTPVWDTNSGSNDGSPTGTFSNFISSRYYFTVSWLGLSVSNGGSFAYSGLDYDGYSGGSSFNAGAFTQLDGSETITLLFADGSSASASLPAGSPSNVNVDVMASMSPVPVPASLPLLALGLGGLGLIGRRKRKSV